MGIEDVVLFHCKGAAAGTDGLFALAAVEKGDQFPLLDTVTHQDVEFACADHEGIEMYQLFAV